MARNYKGNNNKDAIHKFVLGSKELEGKNAEFEYDRGWYSITDILGEGEEQQRDIIYKSKNAKEAYLKWNVYIGRKKERQTPEERRKAREEAKNEAKNVKAN